MYVRMLSHLFVTNSMPVIGYCNWLTLHITNCCHCAELSAPPLLNTPILMTLLLVPLTNKQPR